LACSWASGGPCDGPGPWVHYGPGQGVRPELIWAVPYGSGGSRRLHATERRRARRREAARGGDGGARRCFAGGAQTRASGHVFEREKALREAGVIGNSTTGSRRQLWLRVNDATTSGGRRRRPHGRRARAHGEKENRRTGRILTLPRNPEGKRRSPGRGVERDRRRRPKIEDGGGGSLCSSVRQRERVPDDEKLRRRSGKKTGASGRGLVRWRRRASSLAAHGAAAGSSWRRCAHKGIKVQCGKGAQGLNLRFYKGRRGESDGQGPIGH
jgi:hypothetical protein